MCTEAEKEKYKEILKNAPIGDCEVIRLYDFHGKHRLSILPCNIDIEDEEVEYDLATPDGKVQYCGVKQDLVQVLKENLGFSTLPDDA